MAVFAGGAVATASSASPFGAAREAMHSTVRKLRRQLGDDAGGPKYNLTERVLGYRMPRPDES